jgi:hypothetical protein
MESCLCSRNNFVCGAIRCGGHPMKDGRAKFFADAQPRRLRQVPRRCDRAGMANRYWRMSKDELASACLLYSQRINNRGRRTQTGDEIAALLSAVAWELYGWARRDDTPGAPKGNDQESLRNP